MGGSSKAGQSLLVETATGGRGRTWARETVSNREKIVQVGGRENGKFCTFSNSRPEKFWLLTTGQNNEKLRTERREGAALGKYHE